MSIKKTLASVGLSAAVLIGGNSVLANEDIYTELEQEAVKYRELELLEPLDVTVMSRAELQAENAARAEEDFPHDATADWNTVLVFLGYIEEGEQIQEIYNGLMGDQILGYYDPESKRMVIVASSEEEWGPTDRSTFVHETVHVLQDQHYDLREIQTGDGRSTDDLYFARTSLIEGDASVAEILYLVDNDLVDAVVAEQEGMDTGAVDSAPLFLQESLYFPYTTGAEFIIHLWQAGGWDAVNDAWENPPNTSEQIMHPEKYLEGEDAVPVAINDPLETLGDGWRLLEYNENGELGHSIFLQNGGASKRAAGTATEGWGGDSTFIVTNDEEVAMVWTSAWDTEEDAQEYFDVLAEIEAKRLGADTEKIDDNTVLLTADGWQVYIQLDGDVVTHYMTQSEETLKLMQESQENAEVLDEIPGATPVDEQDATPAASRHSIQFWVREA